MTIKELRELIKDLPDETPVFNCTMQQFHDYASISVVREKGYIYEDEGWKFICMEEDRYFDNEDELEDKVIVQEFDSIVTINEF